MEYNKKISGITTVTLVVTIIVMLILVGVVVANLVGKDGLIKETEEIMNGYDDYKHGEEEKIDELASGIKKSNEKVQIVLTVSTDEWTNQDIVARAEVRNKPNEYYVYMRASESSPWIQTDELTIKASEFTGEQTVTACIAEESDPSKVKPQRQVNIKIGNIDNQLPSQTAPELTLKSEETYKTIIAENKQTDTLSGIDESKTKFAIRKKGQTTWSSWQTESMFTDLEDGTTYEIKSKSTDKAGNEQESEVSEIRTKGRIALATIATIANQTYSGQAFTPEPTITFNGTTLIKGIDYNLSYTNNINAGTATILVVGIGQYLGDTQKTFTINRATPTLTLSNTTVIAGNSASFTATYNGDGTLSASSSDTSKATVSVSGKSVTVKGVAAGSATITVTASQGTNYASKTMTCSATVQAALYSVSSGSPTYHRSLSSAVSTCSAGGTVTALANTTETDVVTISKNITINTNGKTLTRNTTGQIRISAGTTTISGNGTIAGNITSGNHWNTLIDATSNCTFKTTGGPLIKSNSSAGCCLVASDTAILNLGASYFWGTGSEVSIWTTSSSNVTMTSTWVIATGSADGATIGGRNYSSNAVTVTLDSCYVGTTIDSTTACRIADFRQGKYILNVRGSSNLCGNKNTSNGAIRFANSGCTMTVTGNASINVPSTSCTDLIQMTGTLQINTTGYLYSGGRCICSSGSNPLSLTVSKGHFACKKSDYFFYGNNQWITSPKMTTGPGNRYFDGIASYNTTKGNYMYLSDMYYCAVNC